MTNKKKYYFEEISKCEMCADDTRHHKILGQRLNQSQGFSPRKKSGIAVTVKKCSNCGLIYSSPMPIPFDIKDHYGIPPDEYWGESYFELHPAYFSREISIVKELLGFKKEMKALDIGAGLGKCMLALQNAGFDSYGFEPSAPFYEKAISLMKINPDKIKLGMIENIEYENNFFDFITFGAVLEHLYHPADSLAKALKWLKPQGIIHIEVPSSKHLIAKLINFYYWIRGTNYVTNLSPMHSPYHLYEFGLKSFQTAGLRLNYSIEKYYFEVCDIHPVPRFFHFPFRKYMEWTDTGMQLMVYLRKN